jgi:hypothetical protein
VEGKVITFHGSICLEQVKNPQEKHQSGLLAFWLGMKVANIKQKNKPLNLNAC